MSGGTAIFLQNRALFGAMVVHVPLLHEMRKQAHGTPLVVYAPFALGRIFQVNGLADETRYWARTRRKLPQTDAPFTIGLLALMRELRARRYHRILSLRPQSRTLTAMLIASGAVERIGFRDLPARFALTSSKPRDLGVYRAVNYLNLLGVEDHDRTLVDSMAALARKATGPCAAPRRAYCLMPCGSEPPKLWGEENFIALAQAIVARDPAAHFLLVIGAGERRYVELFERAGLGPRTSTLVDAPLPEIARSVLDSAVVVANDCGPSHVAQIAGASIVSLFGNWDGKADARIAEWFHPRPGARCVTTSAAAPIRSLGVQPVLREIERLLDDPRAPGGTVHASVS